MLTTMPPLLPGIPSASHSPNATTSPSKSKDFTLEFEDLSTTAGSELIQGDDIGFGTTEREDTDQSTQEDSGEEAEFSLDARLLSKKRWRSFRQCNSSYPASRCDVPPGLAAPVLASPPGLVQDAPGLHPPSAPASPPGLVQDAPCLRPPSAPGLKPSIVNREASRAPAEPTLPLPLATRALKIPASTLMAAPAWLQQAIKKLSLDALEVDAWEALCNPDPEDPEWNLLVLVGPGGLVGFCTFAFFAEGPGIIMSVHHLVIAHSCRGVGFGRTLLTDLLHQACEHGAWAVKLYSKSDAVGFYEKEGFNLAGPNFLMELRLTPDIEDAAHCSCIGQC
eukprot:TRINITY_DN2668_c0_g1_i1.p1 TRINITY_DN2668_c0_g1~~TRINITY_DN2668_c0_g1_i1.p1  ORF type:complete len:336 (+),score=58.39 TRINITY_DN2668_c0_g1_i1:57-1064(+)